MSDLGLVTGTLWVEALIYWLNNKLMFATGDRFRTWTRQIFQNAPIQLQSRTTKPRKKFRKKQTAAEPHDQRRGFLIITNVALTNNGWGRGVLCVKVYHPLLQFLSRFLLHQGVGSGTQHPHLLQLPHGCRPFSLQEVHLRALKESVKQLRNTDILLPWHIRHGIKAKSPQVWHIRGCWTL